MIGIDIITIKRFQKISKADYTYWSKFFAKDEWEYGFSKPDAAVTLAGIFAAKESVMKALGDDLLERFDRIEVIHTAQGRPTVKIDAKDQSAIHISISHTKDTAVAVAIVYER